MTNTKYYKSINIRKEDWQTLSKLKKIKKTSYTCIIKYAIAAYEKKEASKHDFSFASVQFLESSDNE